MTFEKHPTVIASLAWNILFPHRPLHLNRSYCNARRGIHIPDKAFICSLTVIVIIRAQREQSLNSEKGGTRHRSTQVLYSATLTSTRQVISGFKLQRVIDCRDKILPNTVPVLHFNSVCFFIRCMSGATCSSYGCNMWSNRYRRYYTAVRKCSLICTGAFRLEVVSTIFHAQMTGRISHDSHYITCSSYDISGLHTCVYPTHASPWVYFTSLTSFFTIRNIRRQSRQSILYISN